MAFERLKLQKKLADLAAKGVCVGTSSWKYPGWRGMIYDESRYVTRGKFAVTRFERDCLAEYAETFKTGCVDAGYYRFRDQRQPQASRRRLHAIKTQWLIGEDPMICHS
jgi:hypothetical protein